MCDNTGMNNRVNRLNISPLSLASGTRAGFIGWELLMVILVISLIFRPVVVEQENAWGERSTTLEWEMPMAQLLAQVSSFEAIIDRSWEGMDRKFGYTKGSKVQVGALMRNVAQNGVTVMTAGFVDTNGRWSQNNIDNYQRAVEGTAVAFYNATMEGIR
jgi:hypothetical protein